MAGILTGASPRSVYQLVVCVTRRDCSGQAAPGKPQQAKKKFRDEVRPITHHDRPAL